MCDARHKQLKWINISPDTGKQVTNYCLNQWWLILLIHIFGTRTRWVDLRLLPLFYVNFNVHMKLMYTPLIGTHIKCSCVLKLLSVHSNDAIPSKPNWYNNSFVNWKAHRWLVKSTVKSHTGRDETTNLFGNSISSLTYCYWSRFIRRFSTTEFQDRF